MLSGCGSTAAPTDPVVGLDTTPPPAPTHLTYSHDAQGNAVLVWDASAAPDVASYDVYVYSPSPDRDSAYLLVSTDANNNYVLPTVSTTTETTYRVRAVDTSGNKSAFSASADIITAPAGGGGDFTPIDTK
jgi:fibronectin type 3 domain-containing protein